MQRPWYGVFARNILIALPVLLSLLVACAAATQAPASNTANPTNAILTNVELDIFSGRPNPTWVLSDVESADLASRLKQLPEAQPTSLPDKLGYRGFIVSLPSSSTDMPIKFKIYQTIVQRQDATTTTYYTDSDRSIEQWLVANAKSHLPEETYDPLLKEIGGS